MSSSFNQNWATYGKNISSSLGNIDKFSAEEKKASHEKFKREIGFTQPVFTDTAHSVTVSMTSSKHSASITISKPSDKTWADMLHLIHPDDAEAVRDTWMGPNGDIHMFAAVYGDYEFANVLQRNLTNLPYTNNARVIVVSQWRMLLVPFCYFSLRQQWCNDEMEREGISEGAMLLASYQAKTAYDNKNSTHTLAIERLFTCASITTKEA